ncbi:DUF221-domain-containing protein [Obba rivulosa]|uniref:DUF221-domain-containing protein n=1 Tax=Obba rivulosa TaxID=1052685 RepID=A0A8E2DDR8_9APHY|nr:DUF221-domain-containing protein [Obba rivulosa]
MRNVLMSGAWKDSAERVEWFCARAEKEHYDEEVNILHAEFHRTIKSFMKMSEVWEVAARKSDRSPGAKAYAKQKSFMFKRMQDVATEYLDEALEDADEKKLDYSLDITPFIEAIQNPDAHDDGKEVAWSARPPPIHSTSIVHFQGPFQGVVPSGLTPDQMKHIPPKLCSEHALAEYFEHMDMHVKNVIVCREGDLLKQLLDKRTEALKKLKNGVAVEGQPEIPSRRCPTLCPGWFKPKLDTIAHLNDRFKEVDEMVWKRKRSGKFKATHVVFVTFDKMSSAQVAAQSVLAPSPTECLTHPAPEPQDIVWSAVSYSPASLVVREWIVFGVMGLLLFFWLIPITALASLLSYKEIKKTMPWLSELIDKNQQIRAIVQNSLPSVVIVMLNALLLLLLEGLTYIQGFPARSWIEYSLLKKYFLFLLVYVVFIFLVGSTYWQLVRDLASSLAKGVEKLADTLAAGQARHFFLSYVILQDEACKGI